MVNDSLSDAPAVEARELGHAYGARRALEGVSFRARHGEIFAFLGPNGGGKTTLFRILTTLLPPGAGDALVEGHSVRDTAREVRGRIGVVFQSPSLDRKLTAMENLIHQGRLYGMSGATLRARAGELLMRVGLGDRARDLVERFSGGMRRRVEIAKALLHRPAVLLMDEPSTGLDPGAQLDLAALLRSLAREGVAVLLTTHLMDEADKCDRLGILSGGRLLACGRPDELKAAVGGDVVAIRVGDAEQYAAEVRARFNVAARVVASSVRVETAHGHAFAARLEECFPGRATAVTFGRPSLEDVFIRVTGHRFLDEETAGNGVAAAHDGESGGRSAS